MRFWALCLSVIALSACTDRDLGRENPFVPGSEPARPTLGAALPLGTTRFSNDDLADLFVRLTHDLEWGGRRPHLVRYEASVRVGIEGRGAAQHVRFLDRYLSSLRAGTGIDIQRTVQPHNLSVRFVPGQDFRTKIPEHACVVAPGQLDWQDFRRDPPRFGTRSYEILQQLNAMTVFIPDNAEPWLVRVCLIEEIAQALGPANDLYGLGPSIFNDDAAHVWPTRLDHLMLRVLYQPAMRTGLNRRESRARAREALRRLNPAGEQAPSLPPLRVRAMASWRDALKSALDQSNGRADRLDSAARAARIAREQAAGSAFDCRAQTVLARLITDPQRQLAAFDRALSTCTRAHGSSDIRIAKLSLDRARALFRAGRPGAAYGLSDGLEQALAGAGLDERLVALYALQAASLKAIQQPAASEIASQKAQAWGAYALGRDHPDVVRLKSK